MAKWHVNQWLGFNSYIRRLTMFIEFFLDLLRAVVQVLTSRWLTDDQIRTISSNVVGIYFADWLPTPKEEREAAERVKVAQTHIAEASSIIASLRSDLDGQAQQLSQLIADIEEKKRAAEHYAALAKTNQEAFAPMRVEMEKAIREQLIAQANKGKRMRQVASFIVWLITLVLGAALGAYFDPAVKATRAWLSI
jgi:hypothetical protein